jgi:hypothetical protein
MKLKHFGIMVLLAAVWTVLFPQSSSQANTYPARLEPQVNPNGARILNRTDVNTRDGRKELLTVETIPGVVCVIVSGAMAPGTSTSCVRY